MAKVNANIPKINHYEATKEFLNKNAIKLPNGQWRLKAPLCGFKKVYHDRKVRSTSYWPYSSTDWTTRRDDAIANIVIPAGTVVNLSKSCKLRAEQAYCHSIVDSKTHRQLASAYSTRNYSFYYQSGVKAGVAEDLFKKLYKDEEKVQKDAIAKQLLNCKVAVPNFDYTTNECSPGIHFFLDLQRAINY